MPTRTYYFPDDFRHLEVVLKAEGSEEDDAEILRFRDIALPPIVRDSVFAVFLGVSPKIIFSIRKAPSKHYRSFFLTKKDGSKRKINTPRTYLKVIQWWILDNILNKLEFPNNIFGFVPKRSALLNAEFHFGSRHLLNVDISDFFPSIKIEAVESTFCYLGYSQEVAKMLSEICCLDGCVPQGAPTSPAIANLILRDVDSKLDELAKANNCKYSRYADDLTFSSCDRIEAELLSSVDEIVSGAGFALKDSKTRFAGQGDRMEVTGVIINEKLQPSRSWRKKARARLHQLGGAARLTRREANYLFGIRAMSAQFPESPNMQSLAQSAEDILKRKLFSVVGRSERPILPLRLTNRQALSLAHLRHHVTNAKIAAELGTTEAAVKKRLQESFRKIDVTNREDAARWADVNL